MAWIKDLGGIGPTPCHHFGGRRATKSLLRMADIRKTSRVLVIGCGNGDTAITIASAAGCSITATEVNPAALKEAERNVTRRKGKLRGDIDLVLDDLLESKLERESFDRVIVESVLVMLPKQEAFERIRSLLRPGGVLAMNEGLRFSGDDDSMRRVEDEFAKLGIEWSLPTHDAWRRYLEDAGYKVLSDSSAIPCSLALMGVESFLASPISNSMRFIKVMIDSQTRGFFYRTFWAMRRARLRWGYCLWLARRPE